MYLWPTLGAEREQRQSAQRESVDAKRLQEEMAGRVDSLTASLGLVSNTLVAVESSLAGEQAANRPLRAHIERLTASEIALKARDIAIEAVELDAAQRMAKIRRELVGAKELLDVSQLYAESLAQKVSELEAAVRGVEKERDALKSGVVTRDTAIAQAGKKLAELEQVKSALSVRVATLAAELAEAKKRAQGVAAVQP